MWQAFPRFLAGEQRGEGIRVVPGSQRQPSGQAVAFTAGGGGVAAPASRRLPVWQLPLRWIGGAAARTPGRLQRLRTVLVALSLLTAAVAAASVQARADATRDLLSSSGPLSVHAQDIYQALSDADATAATAFLSGGREPAEVRERYRQDIAQAATSLTAATSASESAVAIGPLHRLNSQLPVYTEAVETARVNHRLGQPLGAAYLREASGLMRAEMLPAAAELYTTQARRLAADQARAGRVPVVAVLFGVGLLACLVAAQVHLRRRTNRVFNAGLLAATGACVVAVAWAAGALLVAAGHLDASRQGGSAPMQALSQARILALQARGDESLSLVNRGDQSAAFEERYDQSDQRLGGEDGSGGLLGHARQVAAGEEGQTVDDAVTAAVASLEAWRAAHEQIRAADGAGQYAAAVDASIGDGPDSAASAFGQLDQGLAAAIDHSQEQFDLQTRLARSALAPVPVILVVLGLVSAAGCAIGVSQRLREYR